MFTKIVALVAAGLLASSVALAAPTTGTHKHSHRAHHSLKAKSHKSHAKSHKHHAKSHKSHKAHHAARVAS